MMDSKHMVTRIYLGMPAQVHSDEIQALEDALVRQVGGLTFTSGVGMWLDPAGKVLRELCFIYEIVHQDLPLVQAFAENMRVALSQKEALVVTQEVL